MLVRQKEIKKYYKNNIIGTKNLIEACKNSLVKYNFHHHVRYTVMLKEL